MNAATQSNALSRAAADLFPGYFALAASFGLIKLLVFGRQKMPR
jgi:hypothetical protein